MSMKLLLMLIFALGTPASLSPPKELIIDTDVDVEDVLALLYLLKQNRSQISLKAITINANEWVNAGFGINMVYDVLYMMGRDDIPVGIGGEGGITPNGTILPNVGGYLPIIDQMESTAGKCRYRQAIPLGRGGGSLDIDTHYGLRRKFIPQGKRHYIPGKQKTAQEVMLAALSTGSNTVLLTGAHTNFALLLLKYPDVRNHIEHVYLMGGGRKGNIFTGHETNPSAEFNIFTDPFAAHRVIHSGLPLTMIPLEATGMVPATEKFINVLQKHRNSIEACYTYETLKTVRDTWPDNDFYKQFFMWDSFAASVAVSGILNGHQSDKNEFAEISYSRLTVVTSNHPYGTHDGSNPLFDSLKWAKFKLKRNGVHSGHVQTGLRDPFCYIPQSNGTCRDGCTMIEKGKKGVTLQVATSAKASNNELGREFYSNFIKVLNHPEQTASFNFQTQFPHYKETHYIKRGSGNSKIVVYDMDMSPGDFITLIYLLKMSPHLIDLKAVTVTATGWANAAAIDIVYDVLHMMGRDDVHVGLGECFALGQAYLPSYTCGDCKYRQAIPHGAAGFLDSDTLYGHARDLPRSPRRYTAENSVEFGALRNSAFPELRQPTATEVMIKLFETLDHSRNEKLTILTAGPLTNVAKILIANSSIKNLIKEIYVLGGSLHEFVGDVPRNKKAEFNMFLDPEAAKLVLESNLDITLVPSNVKQNISSPMKFIKQMKLDTPESAFVARLLSTVHHLKSKEPHYVFAANPLSEVVAAAVLLNATEVGATFARTSISVEASGDESKDGWTRVDYIKGTSTKYVKSIDMKKVNAHVAATLCHPLQSAVVASFGFQQEKWAGLH